MMPILNNHLFPPSLFSNSYTLWHSRGAKACTDLYNDGSFFTFSDLVTDFNYLFLYFQIRHWASSLFSCYPSLPIKQSWEDLLTLKPIQKSLISSIYDKLMALDNHSIVKIKSAWKHELGTSLTNQWWDKFVHSISSITPCARLQLIQFKVLHRVHFSKSRLSEIFPNIADQCDRCHASSCNLSHMFFFCPSLHKFWTEFFTISNKDSRYSDTDGPFHCNILNIVWTT